MHANGNTQHGAQGNQVGTDVTVADGAVVGTPVVHYIVSGLEGAAFLAVTAGGEPSAGPGVVGTGPQHVGDLVGQVDGPAFCDLQHGTQTLLPFQTDHGSGHLGTGGEGG